MLVLLTIKRLVEGGMGWRERERREGEGEKGGGGGGGEGRGETLAQHTYM